MRKVMIQLHTVILSIMALSCIHDDIPSDCGVYLEFIYDHNMEYMNLFDPHVNVVDVFVFDENGKYLFTQHSEREQLVDGKLMFLGNDLPIGIYKILVIGGLSDKFFFSDEAGQEPEPGITTIEQVRLTLLNELEDVSHYFLPTWFGSAITIENKADRSIWPVALIKNTNRFNLTFANVENTHSFVQSTPMLYTFEIATPESGVYSHENEPIVNEPLVYKPYYLIPGTEPESISMGNINTCRLFYRDNYDYRLVVRDVQTQQVIWDYDLMILLENTKPENRPDGSTLPMQEYLDRQSEWNIVILYKGGYEEGSFLALGIRINGWLLWLHDIEI